MNGSELSGLFEFRMSGVAEPAVQRGQRLVAQAAQAAQWGLVNEVMPLDALAVEIEAWHRLVPTEDRLEGVRAFNEKRAPRFSGC